MSLRVGFAGTPEFASQALQAICAAEHVVPVVLTQPDRPSGRGLKCVPSPVKAWAQQQGLPICQPYGLKLEGRYGLDAKEAQAVLQDAQLDVMVVAAYGLILPLWMLQCPRLGCFNIHASLLPRWRGAAPIQRAIEAGDSQSGVTIMCMDEGLDTGAILASSAIALAPNETTASLTLRLSTLGAQLIVQTLEQAQLQMNNGGHLLGTAQPEQGITYAHKIDKADALLDWSASATVLEQKIRALDPSPGAYTVWREQILKVWSATVVPSVQEQPSGTVLAFDKQGLLVQCGSASALRLTCLQRAGGKRLDGMQFFQGQLDCNWVGMRLGLR